MKNNPNIARKYQPYFMTDLVFFSLFRISPSSGLSADAVPVKNDKLPGEDFKVGFKDLTAQDKPPPSPAVNRRKSKYGVSIFITRMLSSFL